MRDGTLVAVREELEQDEAGDEEKQSEEDAVAAELRLLDEVSGPPVALAWRRQTLTDSCSAANCQQAAATDGQVRTAECLAVHV